MPVSCQEQLTPWTFALLVDDYIFVTGRTADRSTFFLHLLNNHRKRLLTRCLARRRLRFASILRVAIREWTLGSVVRNHSSATTTLGIGVE